MHQEKKKTRASVILIYNPLVGNYTVLYICAKCFKRISPSGFICLLAYMEVESYLKHSFVQKLLAY